MSPGWRFSGLRRRCANACAPKSSEGFDLPGLRADAMRFEAVLRNLELIGEAATHVPAEMRIA